MSSRIGQGGRLKGRQPGRPTKWVSAKVKEPLGLGKRGVEFQVWDKWRKVKKKVGIAHVSVFGVRWWTTNGRKARRKSWDQIAEWMEGRS